MKKIVLFFIIFTAIVLNAKTFIREYTYNASDADSKLTSRAISLEQVKRLLLQEIGVYVHSTILNEEVEVSGELKELTAKQIEIISAGITETKIIEENWNGETYCIKAELTADENDVIKQLDKVIEDHEKTKQLEESRFRTEEALAEINRLKQQLARTQDENEKLKLQNDYNQSSNELTAEDWFLKGYYAYENNDLNNAFNYYQKSIEIFPYALAYNNIGIIYHLRENYDNALDSYFRAIEIDPDLEIAYSNIGIAYYKKKDYHSSIEFLQKAVKLNPKDYHAYLELGDSYGALHKYDEAIKYNLKALEIDPLNVEAFNDIGLIHSINGNYMVALENYEKVITIDSLNSRAYNEIGVVYHKQGYYTKAISNYERSIKIDSNNALALCNIGIAYFDLGDYDNANKFLQKAAKWGNEMAKDYLKKNEKHK